MSSVSQSLTKWNTNTQKEDNDSWTKGKGGSGEDTRNSKQTNSAGGDAWGAKPSGQTNGADTRESKPSGSSGGDDAWGSKPAESTGSSGDAWGWKGGMTSSGYGGGDGEGKREANGGGNTGGRGGSKWEVFVRGLNYKATESDLQEFFGQCGSVEQINMPKNEEGKSKGIAFVRFAEQPAMHDAVTKSGSDLMGRKITIELTKAAAERSTVGAGGQGGAGGGQGGAGGGQGGAGGGQGGAPRSNGGGSWGGGDRDSNRERSRDQERNNGGGGGDSGSRTVFVGNLSYGTDEGALRKYFESCGGIKNVRMALRDDGKSKGFAHIEFQDEKAAEVALKKNNEQIDGRKVKVDLAGNKRS